MIRLKRDDVIQIIKAFCMEDWFYTGSYAFGCMHELSDVDIVVPIWAIQGIREGIEALGGEIKTSNYFSGIFVDVIEAQLNIIPLHPVAFMSWAYATEFMTRYVKSSEDLTIAVDRNLRHGVFEILVGASHLVVGGVGARELHGRFKAFNDSRKGR